MKKQRIVVARGCLPGRLPLTFTFSLMAMLKAFDASDVVWGVACTILVIAWGMAIVVLFSEKTAPLPGFGVPKE